MKGLLILFHFSPSSTAGGIQNKRFVDGLYGQNINVDIITSTKDFYKTKFITYYVRGSAPIKLSSIARRIIPDVVNIPDVEYFFWRKKVIKYINQKLDIADYQWVHTIGKPHSVHFIGLYLKNRFGIKWISHFYDPWVENNFRVFLIRASMKYDESLEKNIVNQSDLIIHSNKIISEIWKKRYPSKVIRKLFILPFITDPAIKQNNDKRIVFERNTSIKIIHAGSIYGDRKIDSLLEILKELKPFFEVNHFEIIFEQYGFIDNEQVTKIIDYGLSSYFVFHKRVSYEVMSKNIYNADILLLVDNLIENNVFLPSKVFEYFSYGKPILALTTLSSPAYSLLKESNQFVFDYNDFQGIGGFFKMLVEEPNRLLCYDNNYYKNFLPERIASKYLNLVEHMLK